MGIISCILSIELIGSGSTESDGIDGIAFWKEIGIRISIEIPIGIPIGIPIEIRIGILIGNTP